MTEIYTVITGLLLKAGFVCMCLAVIGIYLYAAYQFIIGNPWEDVPDEEVALPVIFGYAAVALGWPLILLWLVIAGSLYFLRRLVTGQWSVQ